jgi:hypothetical protein
MLRISDSTCTKALLTGIHVRDKSKESHSEGRMNPELGLKYRLFS